MQKNKFTYRIFINITIKYKKIIINNKNYAKTNININNSF